MVISYQISEGLQRHKGSLDSRDNISHHRLFLEWEDIISQSKNHKNNKHVLLNHILLYLCYVSVNNRKKKYITLYTSLKPPLPSRWSNKYLSFNVGWSLNLKGGEKNTHAHENTHKKGSVHNTVVLLFYSYFFFLLFWILFHTSLSTCMTITHLNALVFMKPNNQLSSWIFKFNDQL